MKNIFTFILTSISMSGLFAQMDAKLAYDVSDKNTVLTATANAAPFAATITAADMESYLRILASDDFEGRETGTEGQRKAADFIADHFKKLGLPAIGDESTYFQNIAFTSESWDNGRIGIEVNGEKYKHLIDYYSIPSLNSDRPSFQTKEVVFLGYGIDDEKYSDYKGVDVKDKTILIYSGEPAKKNGKSHLTGNKTHSDWSTDITTKLKAAYKHGVAMVLIIDPEIKANVSKLRNSLLSVEMKMGWGGEPAGILANNMFISSTVAKDIVGGKMNEMIKKRDAIKKKGKPSNLIMPSEIGIVQNKKIRQLLGSNVLGYVEGSDPDLKEEVVVVTAHYDHLGMRGKSVYNGADDNGSGTSAVMDLAQAFVEAKQQGEGPRRSVLFMLVSGEEKGLLGSEYYAENPLFPLENTIANVNIDMIGRLDKKHSDPDYIYVIGSDRLSTDLHDINEAVNTNFINIDLDYTYNAKNDPNRFYYRSDHYNFAKKGIPAIFFFSGVHSDYHRTTDTVDKIMFDKMEKIAKLAFYTTWELANRDERIRVNVSGE